MSEREIAELNRRLDWLAHKARVSGVYYGNTLPLAVSLAKLFSDPLALALADGPSVPLGAALEVLAPADWLLCPCGRSFPFDARQPEKRYCSQSCVALRNAAAGAYKRQLRACPKCGAEALMRVAQVTCGRCG